MPSIPATAKPILLTHSPQPTATNQEEEDCSRSSSSFLFFRIRRKPFMECKQEKQGGSFGEEAAMAAASTTVWSLLHRLANGVAGYLGLARLGCDDDDALKAPAAREQDVAVLEEDVIVEVQSRSANFHKSRGTVRGVGEGGGKKN